MPKNLAIATILGARPQFIKAAPVVPQPAYNLGVGSGLPGALTVVHGEKLAP